MKLKKIRRKISMRRKKKLHRMLKHLITTTIQKLEITLSTRGMMKIIKKMVTIFTLMRMGLL